MRRKMVGNQVLWTSTAGAALNGAGSNATNVFLNDNTFGATTATMDNRWLGPVDLTDVDEVDIVWDGELANIGTQTAVTENALVGSCVYLPVGSAETEPPVVAAGAITQAACLAYGVGNVAGLIGHDGGETNATYQLGKMSNTQLGNLIYLTDQAIYNYVSGGTVDPANGDKTQWTLRVFETLSAGHNGGTLTGTTASPIDFSLHRMAKLWFAFQFYTELTAGATPTCSVKGTLRAIKWRYMHPTNA